MRASPAFGGRGPRRRGCSSQTDDGVSWESVDGFNEHAMYRQMVSAGFGGTPDGALLNQIVIDPRDARTCISRPRPGACSRATIARARGGR